MCGIAGLFHYADPPRPPPGRDLGLRMTNRLAHRGPDDSGLYAGPRVLLGHRRLSILDLSARGRQPMSDPAGDCRVVFNGEIYNFREVRATLEGRGRRFHSGTDTEVLLQAFLEWGDDCVARFNGMFAFAVWDGRRGRLWLARDPFGIKPLFYQDDGATFRFGSEVKAILADPEVPRRPDLVALDSFFTFNYVPAPLTGFQGIRQLPPGHSLEVDRNGIRLRRYYSLPYPDRPPDCREDEAIERFRAELRSAVHRQMVSDVPLGAFLSGGLDSSAVLWAMQGHSPQRPRTFCIGFEEPSFDETPFAREVAERLGAEFRSQTLSARVADLLPALVDHAELPFADCSMIPVYLLSRMTREHVSVALSGDGGDELLAGYDTYRASRYASYYRALPRLLRRGLIAPLAHALPVSQKKYGFATLAGRFVEGAENGPLRDHCSWRQIFSAAEKRGLYAPALRRAVARHDPLADYTATLEGAPDWLSPLEQHLHMDLSFHLPNDMLLKVDRMSMAHALEVRVPLLDLEFVRTCLALPPGLKLHGRVSKYILKRGLQGVLPDRLLFRRKAGFLLPLEAWLRGPLLPLLNECLGDTFLAGTGLLEPDYVQSLIHSHVNGKRNYAFQLFALLVFSFWWRIWIDGSLPLQCVAPRAAIAA
jgi:asparagine synthase (glutamine-hydrolysing)